MAGGKGQMMQIDPEPAPEPLATSHPAIILHEGAVEQLRQAKGLLHVVLVQTKAGVPLQAELLADMERMANG